MMRWASANVTTQEHHGGLRCSYDVRARVLTSAVLVLAGAAVASVPAAAKDGVHATLTTRIPLDAEPGTQLMIGWTLGYFEDGARRPFGASGVFVRLRSASGAAAETEFAAQDSGNFSATVAVPQGGIGDVEIGLRGYTSGVRSGRADMLFPITNEPLPGARNAASPSSTAPPERGEGKSRTWLFGSAAGLIVVAGSAAALARRRWHRRRSPR